MSDKEHVGLRCPDCDCEIVVDIETSEIVFHKSAKAPPAGGKDFDSLLAGLDEDKARAEETFEKEKAAMKDRDRLLDEKFRQAMRRAEEEPDDEPPLRPFDLD